MDAPNDRQIRPLRDSATPPRSATLYARGGKRAVDLALTLPGTLLVAPLLVGLAAAVRFSSGPPVFFRQERVGRGGKIFRIYKFRTMVVDAVKHGHGYYLQEGDPRITRVGRWLRKTSLDELPQVFNVILGDMSLVGPRPERPVFIERFKHDIPKYMLRHKMKTGLTGWAQINGWRGNTSLEKRIQYDLYYIENWSLWFDLRILLITPFKGLIHRHAY